MELHQAIVDVDTESGTMAVLHTKPQGDGPFKRVGIFFDAPGIRRATHEFSAKLASEGYEVIVPDLYHRTERLFHVEPEDAVADPSLRVKVSEMLQTLVDDEIQHDMDDAMEAFGFTDPAGCIGFCLGARAVYRALMRRPERFVVGSMFHPSFLADDEPDSPHLTAAGLTQPLYIGIGEADEVQSIAMHQPFFDAVAPLDHVELITFPEADHGFTWPGYPSYHEEASTTSFDKTLALFNNSL